jgi:hypothetical protein
LPQPLVIKSTRRLHLVEIRSAPLVARSTHVVRFARRFTGFLILGCTLAMVGCPSASSSTANNSQTGNDDNPSGQPLPSTGDCTDRGYFDDTHRFGFNPPTGYTGPVPKFTNDYPGIPILNEYFSIAQLPTRRIDVELLPTAVSLTQFTAAINAQRLLAGNVLVTSENFTTDGGAPATFLVWSSSNGAIYEVFSFRDNTIFALHAQFSLLDSALVDGSIRTAMRSLCVAAP